VFSLLNEFWIDWVSLDVDGVVRGDIYLEMTYYANTPAPAAPKNKLLAPAQGLGRRPSKLSPSNRLSRPIYQNFAGPSPKQPSQLQDRINPTSSHLNNAVPPPRKNSSLLALLMDKPVHASAALPNTQNRRSLSPQSQPVELPSILRPGLGGHPSSAPASHLQDFVRNGSSSDSSSNRPYGTDLVVPLSQLNPYIGGSSAYTPAHTGLSNNVGTSSNPYTGGSGAYITEQQHQQASGRNGYSPAPPDAFMPGNQPAPNGRSYSSASHVATTNNNQYTGGGGFMPGDQQQQVSAGRRYSEVQSTTSVQVSGSSHPSVPITVAPPIPYTGNGGLYLPESQLGPDVPSYPPAPSPAQTSRSPNYSAPTNPYTGADAMFVLGSQQAPDGRAYSPAPRVDTTAQTLGYANHVTPRHVSNGPSLPYNAGTEAGGSVPSGPFAFPMPMVPIVTVMEPYGYHEPSSYKSSHYQPPLPPRTSSVDNNRRDEQELDPYHLARYQTPLPLPPRSIKESPLPPPLPTIATPLQVSSSPPEVVAPAPVPDTTRVEALRKIEQAAAWRKEQELKDMELAMQLDRELNL
jgi:hypothetical protein